MASHSIENAWFTAEHSCTPENRLSAQLPCAQLCASHDGNLYGNPDPEASPPLAGTGLLGTRNGLMVPLPLLCFLPWILVSQYLSGTRKRLGLGLCFHSIETNCLHKRMEILESNRDLSEMAAVRTIDVLGEHEVLAF